MVPDKVAAAARVGADASLSNGLLDHEGSAAEAGAMARDLGPAMPSSRDVAAVADPESRQRRRKFDTLNAP